MPCAAGVFLPQPHVRAVSARCTSTSCPATVRAAAGPDAPVAVTTDAKRGFVITHKCVKCGHTRNNRAQKDDDTDLLIRMTNPHYFDGAGKP